MFTPPNAPLSSTAGIDRRTFVKTVSAAGLGLAIGGARLAAAEAPSSSITTSGGRKRYAIVGTGGRHGMYRDAIINRYKEHAELVGLCDINPGRLELSRQRAMERGNASVPGFKPADFEKMLRDQRVDTVIVTTVDATHDDYIVRALNTGANVITEKPMTTTAEKCQRIIDAKKKSGKNVRVTFNYRYSPPRTQVKDILMSGEIGDVMSVDFQWLLNTQHGADYFRRWHSQKKMSGGLMVHKATHHFDLVNWWLSAVPEMVVAVGKKEFYTPEMAKRRGLKSHHERCRTCPEKEQCTFFMDLAANANLKALYLDNEHHDGYFRDRCVWRPDIDIEDTMNVIVKYDNGATLSYSLNAFNSWEGYIIAFNGTKGRIEHKIVEQVYTSGTETTQGGIEEDGVTTTVIPLREAPRKIKPWTGEGGHGGGDNVMLDDIFLPSPPADKYVRASDERGGAASILVGIAANRCFQDGKPVKVSELVKGFQRPDYAPMPTRQEPLPMPPRRGRV